MKKHQPITLVILTGLSGAGKTTALDALEDLGFFCVDNLPAKLLLSFLQLVQKKSKKADVVDKVAIVIDARGKTFFKDFDPLIRNLKSRYKTRLIYFESRHDVLIQRFSESRRRHPLAAKNTISEGIHREKRLLLSLRRLADKIIDTSDLNVHELKQLLLSYFHFLVPRKTIHISLVSFGYKYGLPVQADLVIDVRFLPNPFFEKSLKKLTGKTAKVRKHVLSGPSSRLFLKKVQDLLAFLINEYKKEGKTYLTIAFGCTGGKHRSVAIAECIKKYLINKRIPVRVTHRDIKL